LLAAYFNYPVNYPGSGFFKHFRKALILTVTYKAAGKNPAPETESGLKRGRSLDNRQLFCC
jgi:hypothetical protein